MHIYTTNFARETLGANSFYVGNASVRNYISTTNRNVKFVWCMRGEGNNLNSFCIKYFENENRSLKKFVFAIEFGTDIESK